jgi:glycosyltransferase involved in cell wall biosynthesis
VDILERLKQAKHCYLLARGKGRSVLGSLAFVIYKTTNLYFKRFNFESLQLSAGILDDRNENKNENTHKTTNETINEAINEITNEITHENKSENDQQETKPTPTSYLSSVFDILSINNKPNMTTSEKTKQKTIIWVIPHCSNIWGGGHYTLFRFIDHFSKKDNIKNVIFLYDYQGQGKSIPELENELNKAFSTKKFKVIGDFNLLPPADIAIATTWQSAYYTLKMPASQKFYFMQDYESLFYAFGTQSIQANNTYTFGFKGITGGYWLRSIYESYGNTAQAYVFSADREIFYPANPEQPVRDTVKKIFFYGRPSTPRRAHELGIAALELVANYYPDIEIVIAGLSDMPPTPFKSTLLGNLTLKETGELYRTCDIGIALSATNMSYLPVELMATGCPVISNNGPQLEWFCQNQHNALLAAPTPSAIFQAVQELIDSKELRQKLAENGLQTIQKTTWSNEMDKIFDYVNNSNLGITSDHSKHGAHHV